MIKKGTGQRTETAFTRHEYERCKETLKKRLDKEKEGTPEYYIAYRNWMIFRLGPNVGLRYSDLSRLTPKNFQDGYFEFTAKKTGKHDRYPMNKEVYADVVAYIKKFKIKDNEYLFRGLKQDRKTLRDTPISHDQMQKLIKDLQKELHIKNNVNTHSFRKSYATWIYQEERDISIVKDSLQHSSLDQSLKYMGVRSERLQRVRKKINF